VVANHQLGGNVFFHADDPNIDQFAIQGNWETGNSPDSIHSWLVKAWELGEGRYNLNMSENKTHEYLIQDEDRNGIRRVNWATAMAGAYVMVYYMDIARTPDAIFQDFRRLHQFFESTHINYLVPHDELKHAGTQYVLALPGHTYIAYSAEKSKMLGLQGMNAGLYDIYWYDCITGESLQLEDVQITQGTNAWKKPSGFGDEVALYVTRTDMRIEEADIHAIRQGATKGDVVIPSGLKTLNIPPEAPDKFVSVKQGVPVDIQLTFSDPDGGPGPYQTSIIIHPSYGWLSGEGNDQIYTPLKGYTGDDIITWKVNDGLSDSDVATIRLKIEK
jgi:hypothetical protein